MNFVWPDTLIEVAVVLLLAVVVRGLLKRLINRSVRRATEQADERARALTGRAAEVLAKAGGLNTARQAQRGRTIGSMLGSLLDAVVTIVVIFMLLQAFGINIMPALASAGIGGLAIGFGAQSLVKDIISGIFLMMEDQLGVGDQVDIGTLSGTVQAMGLRVTRLQDVNGVIWYVRNGEIVTLGNRSQGWSTGNVKIPVALNEDPFKVIGVLTKVCEGFEADPEWSEKILEPPTVLGLSSFELAHAVYQITVKCPANQQWGVERELRARSIAALAEAGIEAPQLPNPGLLPGG